MHLIFVPEAWRTKNKHLAGQNKPVYGRQKFEHSFLYLIEDQFSATEDAVVHVDTFWISTA